MAQAGAVGRSGSPRGARAQTEALRHDRGAFLCEGRGWQADRAQNIRPLRAMRPQACLLSVQGSMARDQRGLGCSDTHRA